MTVLTLDDLCPDGVRVRIDWPIWYVGQSVFIPCIDTEEAVKQATKVAARYGYKMQYAVVIEKQHLGVRIWRTA